MSSIIEKATYHTKRYLFENYGIPQVWGDGISKVSIKKYLPRNPVIIDCGANDGSDSVQLANIYKGQIHAFEPIEYIFSALKLRTEKHSNIHCYQIALGDRNGEQNFFVSEGASIGSSSLLEPKEHLNDHPDTYFKKQIAVDTLTLNSWAEKHSIKKIDMLWLDMQGFEMNMLKAAGDILQTVKVIHTEVSMKETYTGVTFYPDYRNFLEKIGFKMVVEAIPADWDMGNVLFIRK